MAGCHMESVGWFCILRQIGSPMFSGQLEVAASHKACIILLLWEKLLILSVRISGRYTGRWVRHVVRFHLAALMGR